MREMQHHGSLMPNLGLDAKSTKKLGAPTPWSTRRICRWRSN